MNKAKRHHYVSQFLQTNFTDESGALYFFRKDSGQKSVKETGPNVLFVECDLYTLYDEFENKDVSAEELFSDLERSSKPIIEKIIETARAKQQPELTCIEEETLRWFFLCQCSRVPDRSDPMFWSYLLGHCLENPEFWKMSEEERKKFKRQKKWEFLTAFVKNKPSKKALSIPENEGLVIGIVNSENESFIIGSNPVLIMKPSNYEPELWLPIAPDVAVTPCSPRGISGFITFEDQSIRSFNEDIFEQSKMVAGNTKDSIESIIGMLP